MNWIRFWSAVVATLGLTSAAQADHHSKLFGHGAEKACGCAPTCQPEVCRPTIARPCDVTVHTYQRKCADIKPPCCVPEPKACAPACAVPAAACPVEQVCCEKKPCLFGGDLLHGPKQLFGGAGRMFDGGLCHAGNLFNGGLGLFQHKQACGEACVESRCCDADPCAIAELIYQSQTACYAKDRARAIKRLGKYDCVCNPEILCAMIYALNDASEKVRRRAADAIGSQLKRNPCCCTPEVVAALTAALADCDRWVRKEAEKALRRCGYDVVAGCCDPCAAQCGPTGCVPTHPANGIAPPPANGAAPAPVPNGNGATEPAPAPPEDPRAYFPSRFRQPQTTQVRKSGLGDLFGLLD